MLRCAAMKGTGYDKARLIVEGGQKKVQEGSFPQPQVAWYRVRFLAVFRKDDVIYTVGDVMRSDTLITLMSKGVENELQRAINQ